MSEAGLALWDMATKVADGAELDFRAVHTRSRQLIPYSQTVNVFCQLLSNRQLIVKPSTYSLYEEFRAVQLRKGWVSGLGSQV